MPEANRPLLNIWEDTVDLRELLIGLVLGGALGFVSYILSLRVLAQRLPGQSQGVIKGYALMGGIGGCICAAVAVALVSKPKRLLRESDVAPGDRAALLRTLALDPDEERIALEKASPKLIQEMKQLEIHNLFAEFGRTSNKGE